ncbi:MAG: FumA C-terminus/TtdB family hydratase beta subunit [Chloroflexota bacterium]|jgi:L(+)-tartrate dehydratase beta subunit
MAHYNLKTPLSESDIRQLKAGDTVTINGHIFGIRDATQIAIFDHGRKPEVDLTGAVLLHVAPNVKKVGEGKYEPVCVGTTTSTRMNRFTEGLLRDYGVRAITGKSGLYQDSVDALKKYGGVYLAIVGGAASVETLQVEEIEKVYYEDLLPECLWQFRVKDFGPLVVAIDSHGHNLYADVQARVKDNLAKAYKALGIE